jgi:hypothetical protein
MFLAIYLLGFVLSTLYGSLFHLWRGGGLGKLIFFVSLSWVGFWIGHWAGISFNLTFGKIGPLQVASATFGAVVCLFMGYWLSLIRIHPQ